MNRFETASPETLIKLASYEAKVRVAPINTFRSLDQIAATTGFDTAEKLGPYLSGKDTLDLGAGLCGLAIEAYLGKFSRRVCSLSPAAANPDFEEQRWATLVDKNYLKKYSVVQLETAIKHTNGLTFPHFAHGLPFPNLVFDLVIDNWAVSLFANQEYSQFYEAALHEVFRVLKPKGTYHIGDPEHTTVWKHTLLHAVCRQYNAKIEPIWWRQSAQTGWKISI